MAVGPHARVEPYEDRAAEEGRNRYYGEYLGYVKDRDDPEKRGRVRVHVPSLTSDEDSSEFWLDWCLPRGGSLIVPPLDAPVYVTFEQGYITHGVYSWGWLAGSDSSSSEAHASGKGDLDPEWLGEVTISTAGTGVQISVTLPADTARENRPKYPYNKVFHSEGGHTFEMDDTPAFPRLRYRHPSGTTLLVDADGSVHVRSVGAQWYEPGGDFVVALKQGATFKVAYPGGSGFSCGADGFHVGGHAASILGRAVLRVARDFT